MVLPGNSSILLGEGGSLQQLFEYNCPDWSQHQTGERAGLAHHVRLMNQTEEHHDSEA